MAKREEWVKGKKRNFENALGDVVYNTVKPMLNKNSKIEVDLILNWNKIFDSSLNKKIELKKVSFTDKKANKFILHVDCATKDFLEISHSTGIIKEQLTIFMGYNGCEGVKVHKKNT